MNTLSHATSFARRRPMRRKQTLLMLITKFADGPGALPAGLLSVGALAFDGWMLGRAHSRRHEPHSAEV